MLRFYCYASYKFSPVGFAIGFADLADISGEEISRLEPCQDELVRRCFESGDIVRVYGKRPDSGSFCYMVKDLQCGFVNSDGVPSKKYGNFLFEFSEQEDYKSFSRGFSREKLEQAMNEFIQPDEHEDTFALKICVKPLEDYIRAAISDGESSDSPVRCKYLCFETDSSGEDVKDALTQIAGTEVSSAGKNCYSTKKKAPIWQVCLNALRALQRFLSAARKKP